MIKQMGHINTTIKKYDSLWVFGTLIATLIMLLFVAIQVINTLQGHMFFRYALKLFCVIILIAIFVCLFMILRKALKANVKQTNEIDNISRPERKNTLVRKLTSKEERTADPVNNAILPEWDDLTFKIGKLTTSWIDVEDNVDKGIKVVFDYQKDPILYPKELSDIIENYKNTTHFDGEKNNEGFFNGPTYAVRSFNSGRVGRKCDEESILEISLGPSMYFDSLVLNQNGRLDTERVVSNGNKVTIREKYLDVIKDKIEIVEPFLANNIGFDYAIVTKDNYLIVQERKSKNVIRPKKLSASVSEGISRNLILPNVIKKNGSIKGIVVKGSNEEIGTSNKLKEIVLLSFGYEYKAYEWGFMGYAKTEMTWDEIEQARRSGKAKDSKHEINKLIPVEFNLERVVMFINEHIAGFTPMGIVCFVHALQHCFGVDKTSAVIKKYFGE